LIKASFATGFDDADGIAFDSSGNLYVADADGGKVLEFNSNGTLLHGSIAPAATEPYGLAFDSSGDLYVVDVSGHKVLEYNASLTLINTITNASLTDPITIAISPAPASAPALSITSSVNSVKISWPFPSTGWTLQQNSDLSTANWSSSGGISNDGTNNFITITAPTGNLFFRLQLQQ
jgi:sugar lactone lactonase YvrE